jgi:hypothetical protein
MLSGNNVFAQAPAYAGGGNVPVQNFGVNPNMSATFASGIGGLLGGLFGDSGKPYRSAMDQYQKYFNQAQGVQNPFYNAGVSALPQYQNWLGSMQNPSQFINNLMGQYQESPWAKFSIQQGLNANNNAATANGLLGSTPLARENSQFAQGIASQDMQNWLQNVLGINTQYGAGLGNQIGIGTGAANSLTNLLSQQGERMGEASYGSTAGDQSNLWNTIGGAATIASMFL